MGDHNNDHVSVLNHKIAKIIENLNSKTSENKKLKEKIQKFENLIKIQENIKVEDQQQDNQLFQLHQSLSENLRDVKKKLYSVIETKNRYQALIDVCSINQKLNEETIKKLNYYIGNLQSVTKEQKEETEMFKIRIVSLKDKCKQTLQSHEERKHKSDHLINLFRSIITQKIFVDQTIIKVDRKIIMKSQHLNYRAE